MTNDELRNKVDEVLDGMDSDEYMSIWNRYVAEDGDIEEIIHPMSDFNDVFSEFSPFEVADSLSRDFSTGDSFFVYDPSYTTSFDHPFDWLNDSQIDGLIDWIMEGNDGDNAELHEVLHSSESKIDHRLREFAKRILPIRADENPYCFTADIDDEHIQAYIDEYVTQEGGHKYAYLLSGFYDDADANVYVKFDAVTMRYEISCDCVSGIENTPTAILEVGDLREEHFTDFNYEAWIWKASNLVNAYRTHIQNYL